MKKVRKKLKNRVTSILIFPYSNSLEVKITRSAGYQSLAAKVNVYHASYSDYKKVKRLAKLASRMVELNTLRMIETSEFVRNALA